MNIRRPGESRGPGRKAAFNRRYRSHELIVQVTPHGVLTIYQLEFPASFPFFYALFSHYGAFHRLVDLKPDQGVDLILLREALNDIILMFPNPFSEVRGYSNVESSVVSTCENVYARQF